MDKKRNELRAQLVDLHGKVVYTYTAHHKIRNRLEGLSTGVKITQIVLTAISTGGFLATVITNQYLLAWVGGIASALSLGLNLYMKDSSLNSRIKNHKDAADELWDIRENYSSLITDFDDLTIEEIRTKRSEIQREWSDVNKKYPGTDKKGYKAAQQALQNEEEQTFNEGEAEKFLPSIQSTKEN
ncbi:MAG: SLATT domain-containing protein [Lachnospiraceae bacterium]|nr:SLATT domain-containing protein [Lachnospiraceae bacterium]